MNFTVKIILLITVIIGFAALKTYINIKEDFPLDDIQGGVQKTGSQAKTEKKDTDKTIAENEAKEKEKELEKEKQMKLIGKPAAKKDSSTTDKSPETTESESFVSGMPVPYEKEIFTPF